MESIEKRLTEHDAMLLGNGEKDGVLSRLRQLCEEARSRKTMQTLILIAVVTQLIVQAFRMVGLLLDKM